MAVLLSSLVDAGSGRRSMGLRTPPPPTLRTWVYGAGALRQSADQPSVLPAGIPRTTPKTTLRADTCVPVRRVIPLSPSLCLVDAPEQSRTSDLLSQAGYETLRQHHRAILSPLTFPHDDRAAFEIHILSPKLKCFGDAHSGAV